MVSAAVAIVQRLLRLVALLVVAGSFYWSLRGIGLHGFTAPERDGLSMMVLLIGSIYAVMFAFVIFVIWGQFTEVENLVTRECDSLRELMRFSAHVDTELERSVLRGVEEYARRIPKSEWSALSQCRRDSQTERVFDGLISSVIDAPTPAGREAAHQRLIEIARRAATNRDERVTKSLTRIPLTLVRLVNTMAAALLLLVFVYPFRHWAVGFASFSILATVLFLANMVMSDTDNPFEGICNVSAKPFLDLVN
jgi:hypothetical protein